MYVPCASLNLTHSLSSNLLENLGFEGHLVLFWVALSMSGTETVEALAFASASLAAEAGAAVVLVATGAISF